jgi:sodium-dependent dicarboxylate transporter 2/3/5
MITLMAAWWVTEALPIPVTSIIPLVLMPAFGIETMSGTSAYYGKPVIFLFLGGFLIAISLQKTGLHRRIALRLIRVLGDQASRIIMGFMIATAFLSMWISNTATVMVMLPIALTIIDQAERAGINEKQFRAFSLALMLGIAYAADIGGMSTLVGTTPNLVFSELFHQLFPDAPQITFFQWMSFGFPLTVVFLFSGWFLLTRIIFKVPVKAISGGRLYIEHELKRLGHMSPDEKAVGMIFAMTAILWITGSDINISEFSAIPGWRTLLNTPELTDASVAIFSAILLFMVPSQVQEGKAILTWRAAKEIPWGILLLFGGGFALAGAFDASGLSGLLLNAFQQMILPSNFTLLLIVVTVVVFLTEITSNTAIANLLLPVIAQASIAIAMDPRALMIPVTLAASCAFMMPVASPTQAIVFGSGYVPIKQMIRAGIWFNLLGIILIMILTFTIGKFAMGFDFNELPIWAK